MRFSVIVPVYKREDKLRRCLDSLLAQDFPKEGYEIFIVEDGSESGIKALVEAKSASFPNLYYLWQTNRGPASARNLALRGVRGEIVAFTDSDCTVPPNWLTQLETGFLNHSEAVGVGGYQEAPEEVLAQNLIARYESFVTHHVYGAGEKSVLGGFEVPTGGTNNIAYYKRVFEEVGLFDESFTAHISGEDPDFKKRVCDRGYQILYLPLKATHWRDYTFSSFWRQSFERGLGIRHSQIKYEESFSPSSIYWQMLKSPVVFFRDLFKLPEPGLALMRLLERWQVACGQLNYSRVVANAS